MNYFNDHRTQSAPSHILYLEDDTEIKLPTKWNVCSVCDGNGKHVNPSIDCNGISMEEFHDDPDFAEDYFSGTYDVTCYRCHGRTTERVVDWDALSEEQADAYEAQLEADAYYAAESAAERRMGA